MTATTIKAQTSDSVGGLILPLSDRSLLVPNVVVAELVPYRQPEPVKGMPDWYLGTVEWRDLRLPLLSFERAVGGQLQDKGNQRIAVINALGGREKVKFLALLLQGIPRSVRIEASLPRHLKTLSPLELDAVRLDEAEAHIPDLAALEEKLAQLGLI